MGSGAASSKNLKNISGEQEKRRRKKNPKFRKRRRISSSTSSYSSDSDFVSRDRRRRRRSSRQKTEKRRGREPKRSVTRKSLKARHRSASSSSRDSSSSYSTCRSLSSGDLDKRSRSSFLHRDDRKGKLKIRKRGRKLNRDARSSRIRNRSPSCSTCSGNIRRSSNRKRSCREKKSLERDGSAQIGLDTRMASGDEVEKYESGGKETNNKMVMENHNDLRLPQGIVDHNVEGVEEEDGAMVQCSYEQAVDIDRWMGEGNFENYSPFAQFEYGAFIKGGEAQISEPYQEFVVNTEVAKRIKSKVVAADKHDSESDDLELMLRQKALENLKKLRGRISSDSKTIGDTKNESAGDQSTEQPCETSKKFVNSSESHSIISKQRHQGGLPSHVPKVDTFNELSSKEAIDSTLDRKMVFDVPNELSSKEAIDSTLDRKMVFDVPNQSISKQQDNSKTIAQSTSNQQSSLQDSLDKMSSKQYPYRGSQEKATTARCESGNGFMNEVSFGDGSGSMNTCTYGEKKINDSNKTVNEGQSGSQFEQKSFSRMHDGEMVQVSYKVYIPKKTPALARRKLQR